MTDANGSLEAHPVEGFLKIDQLPDTASDFDPAVLKDREACRVITPVVKPPQPFKEQRDGITAPDISDNSAHEVELRAYCLILGLRHTTQPMAHAAWRV